MIQRRYLIKTYEKNRKAARSWLEHVERQEAIQ